MTTKPTNQTKTSEVGNILENFKKSFKGYDPAFILEG